MDDHLLPFQRRFVNRVVSGREDIYALSIPRGNGKSFVGSELAAIAMTPGNDLYVEGGEVVLIAGSIEQTRIVYRVVRRNLEESAPGEYRFIDSATRCAATHKAPGCGP